MSSVSCFWAYIKTTDYYCFPSGDTLFFSFFFHYPYNHLVPYSLTLISFINMAGIRSSTRKNKGKNRRLQELENLETMEMAALSKGKRGKKRKILNDEKEIYLGKRYRTANDDGWSEEAKKLGITDDSVCCLPCGITDLNYDGENDSGLMIQCEKCRLWQHSKCLLGTEEDSSIPEHYMCNVCDGGNPKYTDLKLNLTWSAYIDLMKKGKHMKKEDYILDNEEDEEVLKDDLGEKKDEEDDAEAGNISADNSKTTIRVEEPDDSKEEGNDNPEVIEKTVDVQKDDSDYVDMPETIHEEKEMVKDPISKSNSQDKKNEVKKSKSPTNKGSTILDRVTRTRSSVAQQFARKFKVKLPALDASLQIEDNPEKWAKSMEEELYKAFPAKAGNKGLNEYVKRSRTLIFNLGKANLMDKIVKNGFNFASIVRLTPEEMMRDDYKELANEVKKQSMNQTILPDTNERVRIRRTHRGEEIVESEEFGKKSVEDARLEEIEKLREERERKLKAKKEKELETVGMLGVMNGDGDLENNGVKRRKVSQNTAFSIPMGGSYEDDDESQFTLDNGSERGRQTGDIDMDDDDEFNKILEGVDEQHDNELQENKSGKDEGDKLDETYKEGGDSAEKKIEEKEEKEDYGIGDDDDYDPLDTVTVDPTVWTGKLEFPGAGIISTKALFKCSTTTEQHKGNLVLKAKKMLADMKLGSNGLFNAGRLSMSTADNYLMKVIQSRDFYMDELAPYTDEGMSPVEKQANIFTFMRVWDYFHSMKKFGVIDGRPEYVKDCYIVCLSRDEMLNGFRVPSFLDFYDRDKLFQKLEKEKENEPEEDYEANDKKMFIVFVAKKNLDYILEPPKESFNKPLASIMDQLAA